MLTNISMIPFFLPTVMVTNPNSNSACQNKTINKGKNTILSFFLFILLGKIFAVIKSQMDMLGSASLVHAGLTDLSGLEGLGDHLSHHHHAAAAAHHHYYAQVSQRSLVQT